jgi:outer membrane protein assembly factor BamB
MTRIGIVLAVSSLSLLSSAHSVSAADWPRWRGPDGTGVSRETDVATAWEKAAPKLAWQATRIGDGYSSVVTSGGLLFTTGRVDGSVVCFALSVTTGEKKWETVIGETSRNVMSTPTIHDGRVYAVDPDGELVCLRLSDGKILWERSYVKKFGGRLMSGRGYGESPLIDGDRLLVTPGGADAMIVALDRKTGETIWKSAFPKMGGLGRDGAAFSSLNITEAAGIRQIVQLTGRGLVGIDADSGKFLWSYDGISNSTANIPTPIVKGDLVFSANGYHAGAVLLRIEKDSRGGTGVKVTEVYRLKGNRFQNHHGGCVLIDDHVYGGHGSNNGLPTCLDLATGKLQWKRRGPGTGSASVVSAGSHLVFRYQDGVVALIEATPDEFRLKATFNTPSSGGDSWSHPVISNGKLFLREKDTLWAYDIRRSANPTPPPFAAGSAELVDFSPQGGKVLLLNLADEDKWPNRLFQFVIPSTQKGFLPIITLDNACLTENGELLPKLDTLLQKNVLPIFVSVAGIKIRTAGLRQLAKLKTLVGLDVSVSRNLDNDSFAAIAECPSLVFLAAASTDISDESLAKLTKLSKLAALDLESCDGVTDASCEVLAKFSALRGLSLKKTAFEKNRVADTGLEKLTALSKLERLNIAGNAVTNDGLKLLARFPDLREVDLSILAVDDKGLAHLPAVKKLEWLNVRYSEGFGGVIITNAGIKSIGKVSELTSLNLTGARRVTDACLDDLTTLTKLRSLNLAAAGISAAGIARLQQTLPECQVVSSFAKTTE